MITIEEIQKAFKDVFEEDSAPCRKSTDNGKTIRVFTSHGNLLIDRYVKDGMPYLSFDGNAQTENLILNLPALCKMLIDATAEIERLKADKDNQ